MKILENNAPVDYANVYFIPPYKMKTIIDILSLPKIPINTNLIYNQQPIKNR